MKHKILIFLLSAFAVFSSKADMIADWKLYQSFDANPTNVRETAKGVYFTASVFDKATDVAGREALFNTLFYYDKEGDEIIELSTRNRLSENGVALMDYNHAKKYLLVVYTDCNIDFVYDDGRVYNCVALKGAQLPGTKTVNSISFSPENNEVYLATSFGYVALDDNKYEVKESRNYGTSLNTVARLGKRLLIGYGNNAEAAFVSDPRLSISDYTRILTVVKPSAYFPLEDGTFYLIAGGGDPLRLLKMNFKTEDGLAISFSTIINDNFPNYQPISNGYLVQGTQSLYLIDKKSGEITTMPFGSNITSARYSTYDKKIFWDLRPRLGMRQLTYNNGNWSTTKGFMRPNAPAVFTSTSMLYHPNYGMIVGSSGTDQVLGYTKSVNTDNNVSVLKDGFWKEYSPLYQNPNLIMGYNYWGVAIDPANPDWMWRGSLLNGVLRFSMTNPDDILHLGNSVSPGNHYANFREEFTTSEKWASECFVSTPQFDDDQNLWMLWRETDTDKHYLCFWPKADRLATTSAQNYRPFKKAEVPNYVAFNRDNILLLRHPRNKNIALIYGNDQSSNIGVWYHNGTPTDTRDDKMVNIYTSQDQDGGAVSFLGISQLYEDPETGLVWIMSNRGVFNFNPVEALNGKDQISRIKVARNDGTSLADYLLNEIYTFSMTIDPEGRKWFFTDGAGVVCTSDDGRNVIGEFTTENSYLPSNVVYWGEWNPETNSLMLSTQRGLVELTPSGSGKLEGREDNIRIFPNPVEPDYHGYVRIDNVMDGSVIKVTDSQGNIVREIGPVGGGGTVWDVTGLDHKRVRTGVYYVLISPNSAGQGTTVVKKILIL